MKCIYLKVNNEKCKANAMKNGEYCYQHNPDIPEEEKKEAQRRGGEARALVLHEALPPLTVETPNDAVVLISDTIARVRAGEMDIKTANCIGFLTDKLLKAIEVSRLNDKVEYIERVILEKRST